MPLGPRPEPPPVPRKEPVRRPVARPASHPPGYDASASNTPPLPPKASFQHSPGRLMGPRPIGSVSPVRPSKMTLPYPLEDDDVESLGTPTTISSYDFDLPHSQSNQSMEYLSMPEPEIDPFLSPQKTSIQMPEYESSFTSVAPSPMAVPVPNLSAPLPKPATQNRFVPDSQFIPPEQSYRSGHDRNTRSIFEWGIPAELLPPMPVPVGAMSGLEVGSGGQYTMSLDLPEIPPLDPVRPKFSAEQLTIADFQAVPEIWSLSCLAAWLYHIAVEFDAEFTIVSSQQALTKLFLYRITVLEWVRAETVAKDVIKSLQQQGFISSHEAEDLLILNTACPPVTGVLTLFCGDGCYSPTIVTPNTVHKASCYSPRCIRERRELPVLDGTAADPFLKIEMNWRKFWVLEEANLDDIDPKLIKLQFAIHELIMSEELYVRDLEIYLDVYGEIELMEGLAIMSDQKRFSARVFERIRSVLNINQKLLHKLRERQQQQGPYIQNIADLVTAWARSPYTLKAYAEYSDDYLWADNHLRRELAQNTRLQKWMEERAKDPRLTGRPHSFFFSRVLPRVARYQLLLNAVLKYTPQQGNEYEMVKESIEATTVLTQACDDRIAKQKHLLDVQNLKAHIVFKSSAVTADLKLGDKRRKLIRRGDMLRRGDLKMEWVPTHVLLLDNFLVLSKTREGMNGTAFYVTKAPIPLDLLVLQSSNEDAVVKVASRLTITRHGSEETDPSAELGEENSPAMYPLRISHLGSGGQQYLLFISTKQERDAWTKSIVDAKQSRAQLAFARSAEPFRLEKISDSFAYPESETPSLPVPIPNTPLHRCVGNIENTETSRTVLRRKVNCMVSAGNVYFGGTDLGLWMGFEEKWSQVVSQPQRVIRVDLLEPMNVVIILDGDHNLIWYPLDQLVARGLGDKRHALGTRLNRQRKVLDFQIAYHKGRVVMAYLQQGGLLKVTEPIRSRGMLPMRVLERVGLLSTVSCIDSFREIDRLQVSSDATSVNLFLKSLVISCGKWFEWVTLDTKHPMRIPTGTTSVTSKEMQHWGRPLAVFKVDNMRLLMCYEACCFMCDTNGRMGIQPTTWFLDKCVDVAYQSPYLILFSHSREMVEIRYVDEFPGRLVQLITGKDIKLLDSTGDSVRLKLAHPWIRGRQLAVQLIGNDIVFDNESTWRSSST